MPNNEDEWIDEILIDILCEDADFGVPVEGYIAAAKATIKAKLLEARTLGYKKAGIWGVKYAISQFLKMNLENPRAPVNVDEVKRRAIEDVKRRFEK